MSDIRKYIELIETYERIDESFKVAKDKFVEVSGNEQEVIEYLDKFKELSKRNIIKSQDKDISKWIKAGWNAFKHEVDSNRMGLTKGSLNKGHKSSNNQNRIITNVAVDDKPWLVVIPLNKSSSCKYGKNTEWCTARPMDSYFEEYFYHNNKTLLYLYNTEDINSIHNKNVKRLAISYDHKNGDIELFSQDDTTLQRNSHLEFAKEVISYIDPSIFNIVESERNKFSEMVYDIQNKIKNKESNRNIETDLITISDLNLITHYMIYTTDLSAAFSRYVLNEIKRRLRHNHISSFKDILKVIRSKHEALNNKVEKLILSNDSLIIDYAQHVLRGRWSEGEHVLIHNYDITKIAQYISRNLKKERWFEAEQLLIDSSIDIQVLIDYAYNNINGRWDELERILISNAYIAKSIIYSNNVIKGRWTELEKLLLESKNISAMVAYATGVIKGRWKEAEILIASDGELSIDYALSTGERFIEAEPKMKSDRMISRQQRNEYNKKFDANI